MTEPLRVALEIGPKGKRVAAWAQDWPGLERGAKSDGDVVTLLGAYRARYLPVAELAGMQDDFRANGPIDVVERYPGTGSTDFWGISFAMSDFDREAMSRERLERELALMRAGWTFFDLTRARVSPELQRGPRGGGRDRDQIVRHTMLVEQDWGKGLGIPAPERMLDGEELHDYRERYCAAILDFHEAGKISGKWPLRYLIRHTAYHTLNHAWEMEDKDLTGKG